MTTPSPSTPHGANAGAALHVAAGFDLQCEGLELTGLAVSPLPDGGIRCALERLAARNVHVRTAQGAADIARVSLVDVTATLVPGGREIVELAAADLRIEGMDAVLHGRPGSSAGAPSSPRLDALADLDGLIRAFVTDALWFIDAEIVVPIAGGAIDFNRVEVEHVGPNSALAVGGNGVEVETPGRARMNRVVFERVPMPGASPKADDAPRVGAGDRGRLDLLPFLDAFLRAPRAHPVVRPADPALAGALGRTKLEGELRMGDGALGSDAQHLVLAGRDSGKNRVALGSAAVAQRVAVSIPALAASASSFALPGKRITTAALEAVVEAHVVGEAADRAGPAILATITQATLRDVRLAAAADE
jgi:hypothetical protein